MDILVVWKTKEQFTLVVEITPSISLKGVNMPRNKHNPYMFDGVPFLQCKLVLLCLSAVSKKLTN